MNERGSTNLPKRLPTLRDRVVAGVSRRTDFTLEPQRCALLIIDIQTYLSNPTSSKDNRDTDSEDDLIPHEHKRDRYAYYKEESLPNTVQNIQKLAQAFRVLRDDPDAMAAQPPVFTGCEVIFTYLQSLTKDGRDISLDYKLSGPLLANIPRLPIYQGENGQSGDYEESFFLPELQPDRVTGKGDILIPKTSCNVFRSTNLDYVLRNLMVEQLVIVGQLTDQCIESTVRDAADLGYFVTVVSDACAAHSYKSHKKGLHGMKGFCRIVDTRCVLDELLDNLQTAYEDFYDHQVEHKEEEKEAAPSMDDNGTTGKPPKDEKQADKEVVAPEMTDESVLTYLRDKGMNDAAAHLKNSFRRSQKREIL